MNNISIYLSTQRKHLIFTTKTFLDGIEFKGRDKIGILAIENINEAEKIFEKAKTMTWRLGDKADEFGFYSVERIK